MGAYKFLEHIKSRLNYFVASGTLREADRRLLRKIAIMICAGFTFILIFGVSERSVEKNRTLTAQRFETLINANLEVVTISQHVVLLLFGMLNPREIQLQSRLTDEVRREIQRMQQEVLIIKDHSPLSAEQLSPAARENLESAVVTSLRFTEMAAHLVQVLPGGKVERPLINQFADQAGLVLMASRRAIKSLSADAVSSAKKDERIKLILFALGLLTTIVTALLTILFVLARLRRALETLRATELNLVRANDDLERFASIVAHDLAGPLNNIALGIKVLEEKVSGPPKVKETADAIGKETGRLGTMVQALLRLSRTQWSDLFVTSVDMPEIIEEIKVALRRKLDSAAAMVRYEGLRTVQGDRALLQSLFQNLIENSLRYRREEAAPGIEIRGAEKQEHDEIVYEDNGRGIPADQREHVFEPFVQLQSEKAHQGLGLGLSVVKRIVTAHGGRIFIADREGPGTRFIIILPKPLAANTSERPRVMNE